MRLAHWSFLVFPFRIQGLLVFIARAAESFPRFPPSIPGLPSYSCRVALVSAGKPGIGAYLGRETWTRRECVYARRG